MYENLWKLVASESPVRRSHLHGPDHWARVERNGLLLSRGTAANRKVVRLFALFHDSMRLSDGRDPEHGARSAEYARSLLSGLPDLTREELETLCRACEGHTSTIHHPDVTIGVCWDSDRLDLPRIGIDPRADLLNTEAARRMAARGDLGPLERLRPRPPP